MLDRLNSMVYIYTMLIRLILWYIHNVKYNNSMVTYIHNVKYINSIIYKMLDRFNSLVLYICNVRYIYTLIKLK